MEWSGGGGGSKEKKNTGPVRVVFRVVVVGVKSKDFELKTERPIFELEV